MNMQHILYVTNLDREDQTSIATLTTLATYHCCTCTCYYPETIAACMSLTCIEHGNSTIASHNIITRINVYVVWNCFNYNYSDTSTEILQCMLPSVTYLPRTWDG